MLLSEWVEIAAGMGQKMVEGSAKICLHSGWPFNEGDCEKRENNRLAKSIMFLIEFGVNRSIEAWIGLPAECPHSDLEG